MWTMRRLVVIVVDDGVRRTAVVMSVVRTGCTGGSCGGSRAG